MLCFCVGFMLISGKMCHKTFWRCHIQVNFPTFREHYQLENSTFLKTKEKSNFKLFIWNKIQISTEHASWSEDLLLMSWTDCFWIELKVLPSIVINTCFWDAVINIYNQMPSNEMNYYHEQWFLEAWQYHFNHAQSIFFID